MPFHVVILNYLFSHWIYRLCAISWYVLLSGYGILVISWSPTQTTTVYTVQHYGMKYKMHMTQEQSDPDSREDEGVGW